MRFPYLRMLSVAGLLMLSAGCVKTADAPVQAPVTGVLIPCGEQGVVEVEPSQPGFRYYPEMGSAAQAIEVGPLMQFDAASTSPRCALCYVDVTRGEYVVEMRDLSDPVEAPLTLSRVPAEEGTLVLVDISETGDAMLMATIVRGAVLAELTLFDESGSIAWSFVPDGNATFDRISSTPDLSRSLLQFGADDQTGAGELYLLSEGSVEASASVGGIILSELWDAQHGALVVTQSDSSGAVLASLRPLGDLDGEPLWQREVGEHVSQAVTSGNDVLLMTWASGMDEASGEPGFVTSQLMLLDSAGERLWLDELTGQSPCGYALSEDGGRVVAWVPGSSEGAKMFSISGEPETLEDAGPYAILANGTLVRLTSDGPRKVELR